MLVKRRTRVPRNLAIGRVGGLALEPLESRSLLSHTVSAALHALHRGHAIVAVSADIPASLKTTETTLTTASNPTVVGKCITLTAHVTSLGAQIPSGTVVFKDGSTVLGQATLDSSGSASLKRIFLGVPSHELEASYQGNGIFIASSGTAIQVVLDTQTVGPQLVRVLRFGYHQSPTTLVLNFNAPLDPLSVRNLNNYQITAPNGLVTLARSAAYDASNQTITLRFPSRLNIHWTYHLLVRGNSAFGILGANGAMLNSPGNGQPGTNSHAVIDRSTLVLDPP
jgi:hypothetical protein